MGRVKYKIVSGRPCGACGRTQRFASNRRCVFCANWDAHDRADWSLIMDLGRDHRLRQRSRLVRARRRAAEGSVDAATARDLLAWQNGQCVYCSASTDLHLDHAVPVSRGGVSWWWNMQWLCRTHNLAKGALTDSEYRARTGLRHVNAPKRTIIYIATLLASF